MEAFKDFLEYNENKNTMKMMLRGKFIAWRDFLKNKTPGEISF